MLWEPKLDSRNITAQLLQYMNLWTLCIMYRTKYVTKLKQLCPISDLPKDVPNITLVLIYVTLS